MPLKFTPEIAAQVRQFMEEGIPFNKFLGIKCTKLRDGFVRLELPFREEFIGDPVRPAMHGGLISTLADTCGGAAVYVSSGAVEGVSTVSTVDLRIDYLRPGRKETLVAEAKVVRQGNRVGVVDILIFHLDAPEKPIATGKGVYNIRRFTADGTKEPT